MIRDCDCQAGSGGAPMMENSGSAGRCRNGLVAWRDAWCCRIVSHNCVALARTESKVVNAKIVKWAFREEG